jgi:pimeloyl-ACP methyl ester carboxylesterase
MTSPVIALPGGMMPASPRYAPLREALVGQVHLYTKDLEVYSGEELPAGYSIDLEVNAVARFADSLGLERFHLLGYSGGGFVSLAFAGAHPDRLLSLALFEPAAIPGSLSEPEVGFDKQLQASLSGLSGPEFIGEFMRLQLRPGVEVPRPAGPPPPPWMANRPAGIAAMMAAFGSHPFNRGSLRECRFPVFLGYGDLTGQHEEVRAGIMAQLFPDIHIRRFSGIHHFVSPQEIYNPDHVQALRALWSGAPVPAYATR